MVKEKDIKNAVFLNTMAIFIYFFVQWILTVIVTRMFDFQNAGVFTLAVSLSNIFCYISNFGVRNIQISDSNRTISRNTYISTRILTSLFSTALFIIAIVVSNYDRQTIACCIAMMVYKLMESYADVIIGEMQVVDHYDWIAVSYFLKSGAILLMFVILALLKYPLRLCIYGMCVGFLFVFLIYDLKKTGIYNTYFWETSHIEVLLKRSFPLTVMSILDSLVLFIPKHFVEVMYGSTQLGYYGTVTIVIIVLSTLGSAVWSSLLPVYSLYFSKHDQNGVKRMTKTIIVLMIVLSFLLLTIGRNVAPLFYKIIFGEEILKHMYLLTSVIINSLLLLYNSFFVCILVPIKKNNLLAISDLICVIVLLPLCCFMCRTFGLLGASYSLSIALCIKFLILLIRSVGYIQSYFKII